VSISQCTYQLPILPFVSLVFIVSLSLSLSVCVCVCVHLQQQVTACETQFSLRGAVAFACLQSATFEVTLVGAQVLKFRADSNDQRQACIEAINHINTQTPSAKSIIKSGAVVCSIYGAPWTNTKLSLMDNCLMIQPSAQVRYDAYSQPLARVALACFSPHTFM